MWFFLIWCSSSGENSIQHQFRSQLDRNVSLQKEKAELELSLAEKVKLADVAKEQNGELQEELQSTKDSMQKLVESYEENTTKGMIVKCQWYRDDVK